MIDPKLVCHIVKSQAEVLMTHNKTIDILEGNLEPYLLKALSRQLSERVFAYAKDRLVPINILPRYVDKISNIYMTGVIREVVEGNEDDQGLLSWYENELEINNTMNLANRLYNACKSTLIYAYANDEGPALRVIPNDQFVVWSNDPVNPTKPTMVILLVGKKNEKDVYWVYTEQEFAVVISDETIDYAAMESFGLPDGINPYGVLPFIYINSSKLRLSPIPDKDSLRMTEFVPIALTDLNLAAMFSAFSITHITNGSVENLVYAPNALWFLKSDDPEKDVQIGTLKPEVDYQEVLNLIQSELSLWMGTKGIKSSSVGQISVDNAASGIAKLIDESDTFDVRRSQTIEFSCAEHEMWEMILMNLHPIWVSQGIIKNRAKFSPSAEIKTKFSILPVGTQRAQILSEQRDEYAAGFTTRQRAVQALNPQMTMQEVDLLIEEIDEERYPSNGDETPEDSPVLSGADTGQELA